MRVLLVYANKSRDLTAAPPVGLSYVATAASHAGHQAELAVRLGLVAADHDYAAPTFYVSPDVEEDWIVARVQRALRKNPGIVHAAEQGVSKCERVFNVALAAFRFAPPYWRFLPLLMRMPPLMPWRRRVAPVFAAHEIPR